MDFLWTPELWLIICTFHTFLSSFFSFWKALGPLRRYSFIYPLKPPTEQIPYSLASNVVPRSPLKYSLTTFSLNSAEYFVIKNDLQMLDFWSNYWGLLHNRVVLLVTAFWLCAFKPVMIDCACFLVIVVSAPVNTKYSFSIIQITSAILLPSELNAQLLWPSMNPIISENKYELLKYTLLSVYLRGLHYTLIKKYNCMI